MQFSDFKNILLKINDFKLPGVNSFLKLAPPTRFKQFKEGFEAINPDHAAVMLLLYPDKNLNTRMSFILRNKYNGVHSNQVSFPGGKIDKLDNNLSQTAIRETVEELGVNESNINIIKPLTQIYIPPSNFNVQPFVATYDEKPFFYPDSFEVSKVIEPLLEDLFKVKNIDSLITLQNKNILVPSFNIEGHVVWGATAMILNEFITLMKNIINS
jgi:8-oxo-dGTP pyrophosphatase MutT (NUDIX family)